MLYCLHKPKKKKMEEEEKEERKSTINLNLESLPPKPGAAAWEKSRLPTMSYQILTHKTV